MHQYLLLKWHSEVYTKSKLSLHRKSVCIKFLGILWGEMEILVARPVLKMHDASQAYSSSYVERVNIQNKSSEHGILKTNAD